MRISDWSSDVCSSDLITGPAIGVAVDTIAIVVGRAEQNIFEGADFGVAVMDGDPIGIVEVHALVIGIGHRAGRITRGVERLHFDAQIAVGLGRNAVTARRPVAPDADAGGERTTGGWERGGKEL